MYGFFDVEKERETPIRLESGVGPRPLLLTLSLNLVSFEWKKEIEVGVKISSSRYRLSKKILDDQQATYVSFDRLSKPKGHLSTGSMFGNRRTKNRLVSLEDRLTRKTDKDRSHKSKRREFIS